MDSSPDPVTSSLFANYSSFTKTLQPTLPQVSSIGSKASSIERTGKIGVRRHLKERHHDESIRDAMSRCSHIEQFIDQCAVAASKPVVLTDLQQLQQRSRLVGELQFRLKDKKWMKAMYRPVS